MSLGTAHTYYLHMSEDMKTCTFGVDSDYVDLAAEVFALLADPTRIRIILSLRDGEMSVKDLADIVGKRPTAVSQHLGPPRRHHDVLQPHRRACSQSRVAGCLPG